MAHAFYVQMGGVVVYGPPAPQSSNIEEDIATNVQPDNEVNYGANAGYQSLGAGQESGSDVQGSLTSYMAKSLSDIQPDMFRIPESEIKDLSKADVITKAFAIIQCTWLVVQSVSRVAQGYAISLLELATLAFIFCAFVMHVFWWNKPFDVESRRIVKAIGPDIKVSARLSTPSMDDLTARNLTLASERVGDLSDDYFDGILNLLFGMDAENFPSISLYITSTAFVAIHLAAWNWEFPSTIVRSLWRWLNVSTLVASFTPWMTVFMLFLEPQQPTLNWLFNATLSCFGNAGILTYAILRLVVLGLTFYCLSSMPERAYATLDWLAWVPHFS